MKKWSKFLGAAVVALAMGWGGSANAELVTSGSAAFDVFASCTSTTGCNGGTPSSTVSGELQFSNFTFSPGTGGTVDFSTQITATNTTSQGSLSLADFQSVRLTSFGFDTIPDATSLSTTSTVYTTAVMDETFPGFMKVDVCNSSGSQNCAGGANGGLTPGGSDTFTLTLLGLPSGTTSIDLGTDVAGGTELFDFKFQTGFGSFETSGSPCVPGTPNCVVNPPTTVPEPGSLVLMGTALVGLWGASRFMRRRKGYVGGGFAA